MSEKLSPEFPEQEIAEDRLGAEPSEQEVAQDRLDAVLPSIEAVTGDRFGGLWIDWTSPSTVAVAVVRPTQEDVDRIGDLARSVGWSVVVQAVRYSNQELEEFADRLTPLMTEVEPGLWFSLAWSPVSNKVEVELTRVDPELIRTLAATIPVDALSVRIAPGLWFQSLEQASAPLVQTTDRVIPKPSLGTSHRNSAS